MWHILDEFRIASYVKELIEYIGELVDNYPRREYVLKDRMVSDGYELLELVYLGNVMNDRLDIQKKILAKISMLDTYLEMSYKRHCISLKRMQRGARYLTVVRKMVYGWIKSGSEVRGCREDMRGRGKEEYQE